MSPTVSGRLLLDEMFAPRIAAELRKRGHDVLAVVEEDDLRAMTDDHLFAWAAAESRWLVTENVKDFRPLLLRDLAGGGPVCRLLFTSARSFPRSRRNPGPLIEALAAWIVARPPASGTTEVWLPRAGSS